MFEQYLDETQVAAGLGVFVRESAIVLRNSLVFPRSYAEVLAAQLTMRQAAALSAPEHERVRYLRYVTERIETADMRDVVDSQESEPYLDSLCYELACVVKLPTFEHYVAELAA